jgi:dihydrofolate reductase
MRKLIESTLVSLDGVTEAPEQWVIFDDEAAAYSLEQLGNYDAFVMGRVTYEQLFVYWGHTAGNPYIDHINAMPKYGTSRFDDTLVRDHLIDEFRFWIMPVVAGSGRRLFEDVDTSGLHLRLTGQKSLENGSVILTYAPRPPGEPDEAGAPASNEEEK